MVGPGSICCAVSMVAGVNTGHVPRLIGSGLLLIWLCDRGGNLMRLEASKSEEAPAEEVWL